MSEIRPQQGPQERFLSSPADIAVFGGGAGGGKTWALLMETLRHVRNPGFGAVVFRRTSPQVRAEGGLWDESHKIYARLGAVSRETFLQWRFPSGARVGFAHLEYDTDRFNWDGAQIPLLCFDQLEHFSHKQFFYLLGRNRSVCGVRPYVRATCNPDPDCWLKDFLDWWIDPESGYAIEERSGVIRWFVRRGDEVVWAQTREEIEAAHGRDSHPLSVTFVPARVTDNKILLEKDPAYLAKLKALPLVERERLEKGNWNIRPAAGLYFRRAYFEVVEAAPAEARRVRYWDLAATKEAEGTDPDWTVGLKMARAESGLFFVEHVARFRESPYRVEQAIKNTASADGKDVMIGLSQDPGQAGKSQVQHLVSMLAGSRVTTRRETGDKVTRAGPFSAQAEAGNVHVVRGPWNDAFFAELENFPEGHDDQVDAAAGALQELSLMQPLAFN